MVPESLLIAAAALKTPTRNGYNAQDANHTLHDIAVTGGPEALQVGGSN